MTINAHRSRDRRRARQTRVFIDGVDVSARCFYVDARRRRVRLYLVDFSGHKLIRPDLEGAVVYERLVRRGSLRVVRLKDVVVSA